MHNSANVTQTTTCPYCGVGCGISSNADSTAPSVNGDTEHPSNFGKLCSKGSTLGHTLIQEGRLLHPQIKGLRASWDQAIGHVAKEFKRIIEQHGPNAVAFYVSGQLLTEDYYVANKLMKGFIGSANIDTNSRLCMSSAVAAYKRAFGEDCVPANYEDLELAELMVFAGSNAAWCHPILFQRIKAAKSANPNKKTVVIDPRKTATCEIADLHLPIKPGTDVTLFNGLLCYLADQQQLDTSYIEAHCENFEHTLEAARQDAPNIRSVAEQCDLNAEDVETFYQWFSEINKTVTCFSQGINQSSQGTDKGNAIINCHLATGRVGKPGASPFSLTGQPNAMGGREVGGLANQLAAHKEFNPTDINTVATFWQAPNMAQTEGLKAVELFNAIEEGQVKAIWIMGTNPVVSMPNANQIKRALQKAELVVVSDCIEKTDTSAFAHVLLPATGWGEKSGTVTNSERRISRQKHLMPPSGEALSDWRILTKFAHAMGWESQFPYTKAAQVFREHAALSNTNTRQQFKLGDLDSISDDDYKALPPIQWPVSEYAKSGAQRLYTNGQFSTPNGKARFVSVTGQAVANPTSPAWPLALNSGRIRDQWHTMTRTALAPQLNAHKPEPFVEIHPQTAQQFGLTDSGYATVTSPWGSATLKVAITDNVRPNDLFVPMHWNDQWASGARIGALVNPATDPVSGQPESKHTPCKIAPWQPKWIGFLFSRDNLTIPQCQYASKIQGAQFYRYELAHSQAPENQDWASYAKNLAQITSDTETTTELIAYEDPKQESFRYAWIDERGLSRCLYIGKADAASVQGADRGWLASLFEKNQLKAIERKALLSGRSPAGVEDCGRIVCACFGVGEKTITKAIEEHNLTSAADVGKHLKAGTNCGSCVSEIKELLV